MIPCAHFTLHSSLFTLHSSLFNLQIPHHVATHSLNVEAFAVAGQLRQQLSHKRVAVHTTNQAPLLQTSLALKKSSLFLAGLHTHIQQPNLNPIRPNMPTTWTAERDQRLLLLLVEQVKVNGDAVAAAWKTKYGK